jgi:hypothetical protein
MPDPAVVNKVFMDDKRHFYVANVSQRTKDKTLQRQWQSVDW